MDIERAAKFVDRLNEEELEILLDLLELVVKVDVGDPVWKRIADAFEAEGGRT